MIKLIASDIDGTLLQHGAQAVNEEVFTQIKRLKEKGILFVAASGRQYNSLRNLFAPVADDILFLCENGGIIYKDEEVLTKLPMPDAKTKELIRVILDTPDCEVLISGANTSYVLPKRYEFVDRIRNVNKNNVTIIESLDEIPEEILKVASFCYQGSAGYDKPMGDPWRGTFNVALAGEEWLDFTTANKGSGMKALLEVLGIEAKEVMAFGDNFNDLSMLEMAGHPYVIENCALDQAGYRNEKFCHTPTVEAVLKTL